MPTKIKKCVCDHEFQDKRYGKKMRVMNLMAKDKDKDLTKYRCTVCLTEHTE